MAAKCSTSSAVIWSWVIETLADSEQVDTATLIGLVKMAPSIPGDIGKDAREMISLRILESLFVHGKEASVDTDSSQNAKISFDPSERSEDVLQRIFRETPELISELEKEKWDVCPFLMHKRASLRKCPLKKLKETILESSHPLFVSLKERSKLVTANAPKNINMAVDDDFDPQTTAAKDDLASLNPEKDKNGAQTTIAKDDLASLNPEKDKNGAETTIAKDDLASLNPEKDKNDAQTTVAMGDVASLNPENDKNGAQTMVAKDDLASLNPEKDKNGAQTMVAKDDLASLNPEKDKNDAQTKVAMGDLASLNPEEDKNNGHSPVAKDDLASLNAEKDKNDTQTTVGKDDLASLDPGKDKNKFQENLLREADQVGNSIEGTIEHTGREESEFFIEHSLECSNGNKSIDHDEHAASEKLHCNDDNMFQDTYREKHDKRVLIEVAGSLKFVGKFKDPKNSIQENALNGGASSVEKISMEHDGQLETSSDNDSERSDDERTDIAAKKEAFLNSHCTPSQDSMAMTDWTEINLCMKCNKGGQLLVCSSDACPLWVHESCLGFAATLDENAEFFCPFCAYSRAISRYLEAKRKAFLARKDLQAFSSFGVKHGPNKSSKKRRVLEKNEVRQTRALGETLCNDDPSSGEKAAAITSEKDLFIPEPSRSCVNNNLSCDNEGLSVANRSTTEAKNMGQKVGEGCESPRMEEHQPSTPKKKCKEKESHKSIESSYSIRPRKRKPPYTPPAVPSSRRKVLPWTKPEEEILKEGVQKYSSVKNKGIPWTEILDFGRNVFHKGRTPIDLKDKWRNICKGTPKAV